MVEGTAGESGPCDVGRSRGFCENARVADHLRGAVSGLALAVIVGALVAAPAARAGGSSAFSTGFWCGPPVDQSTRDRFLQVLDAGFTFSTPPCASEGYTVAQNEQILDAAQEAGVPVIVWDNRMQEALANPSVRAQLLDAIVLSYSSHPALAGYYVYDEPFPELFGDAAAVVAHLRARDPQHPSFINLFPNYAPISDYDQYLRDYVQQVRPATIVYDFYPFLGDGTDLPGFFANLNSVRRVALDSSTPFWQIVQLTKIEGYRRASENEKLWSGLQSLTYGAHGVMFFTYWSDVTPLFPEPGVIDPGTGLPTDHYLEVQRVNTQVRAFGQHLVPATSQVVFHNGPLALGAATRPPRASIYFPSSAAITTGLFDSADYSYTMLANRDYRAAVSTPAVLSFGTGRPEQLDVSSGQWVAVNPISDQEHSLIINLTLAPAAGALFRTRKPVPSGPPGAEIVFGRVRSNAGQWHLVDSGVATYRLRDATWRECPSGFTSVGMKVQPNGFWLCARNDLAGNRFYVGNVVGGIGTHRHRHRYFRVKGGSTTRIGAETWSRCRGTSRLVGKFSDPNGFWVCMEEPQAGKAAFGRVRSNTGHLHVAELRGTRQVGFESWSYCPLGSTLVGRLYRRNGFWLCARNDLATRAFYVGNVVKGARRYYRVQSGRVKRLQFAPRLYCRGKSTLIGQSFGRNGFWLCGPGQRVLR